MFSRVLVDVLILDHAKILQVLSITMLPEV